MNNIDISNLLNRNSDEENIVKILKNFDVNNCSSKKGIYLYGNSGSGKTTFILNILKKYNYDIILYNACDIRNKSTIESITKDNVSNTNVINLFHKNIKKPIIVMDEIDSMINGGDKGGLTSLIKLLRPKKTKKQKGNDNLIQMNPIICIGNYSNDKKINELIKVCHTIEIKTPNDKQIENILNIIIPELKNNKQLKKDIINYIQGDLKKINIIYDIYKKNPEILTSELVSSVLQKKINNDNVKNITQNILNNDYSLDEHLIVMNETDRTIIGLLWHENIVDILEKIKDKNISIPIYLEILKNISFSDYIDRVTFQKQIWQFNEMTSLIKTFKNNKIFHEKCKGLNIKSNLKEIRFTKVLTKYSTQYNNECFIQYLCQKLMCDKKDLFNFFTFLKEKYTNINDIVNILENYDIKKLDINRIFRYLEKSITDSSLKEDLFDDKSIDEN